MIPKATIIIAALCIGIYAMEFIYPNQIMNYLSLDYSEILLKPWALLTYMFVHASNQHIVYNMFGLIVFGMVLESIIGSRRFALLFLASGITSGIAGMFFYPDMVGASGAVFGIIGCLAVLRPKIQVWVFFITAPMAIAAMFYVLFDIIGIYLPDNIAHIAHLAGIGTGLIYGFATRNYFRENLDDHVNSNYGKDNDKDEPITESELEEWEDENMGDDIPKKDPE